MPGWISTNVIGSQQDEKEEQGLLGKGIRLNTGFKIFVGLSVGDY